MAPVQHGVAQLRETALDEAALEEPEATQPSEGVVVTEGDQCAKVAEAIWRDRFALSQPSRQMADQMQGLLIGTWAVAGSCRSSPSGTRLAQSPRAKSWTPRPLPGKLRGPPPPGPRGRFAAFAAVEAAGGADARGPDLQGGRVRVRPLQAGNLPRPRLQPSHRCARPRPAHVAAPRPRRKPPPGMRRECVARFPAGWSLTCRRMSASP